MKNYKHVSYLWDEAVASTITNEVDLFIYRSNLLGADLRLTNYGGGNTSVKIIDKDPLTGQDVEVMWIKGSGGDIGTLKKLGCAALYMERLLNLEKVYRGVAFEDEMVELFNHCIFDLNSKAPSIDTPLHAFLPYKHIDHLHPDAAIAIAACADSERVTEEMFNGEIGWVPWKRPGFELGLMLRECLQKAEAKGKKLKGIMLGSHGLFTWGDTSYESYVNTLNVIEQCAEYIEQSIEKNGGKGTVFGGEKVQALSPAERKTQAAKLAPILRGLCSNADAGNTTGRGAIGHFNDSEAVLQFINSHHISKLAPMGTSCPDHFLRTKIAPLVLELSPTENLDDATAIKEKMKPAFLAYRESYKSYYDTCKHANSPALRDTNPVVILYPGVGMFTFAKDKTTARLASEYYTNAINVMRGAEAVTQYTSLPHQEAFNIEYWLLEEAKLQRMPKPKPLSGRVALITGSAGGIGKATARRFINEGACVVLNDIDQDRLDLAVADFTKTFGKDAVAGTLLNVTDESSVNEAINNAVLAFGGIDIVVNNAGISISKPIAEQTVEEWDRLYDILVKGQFIVSKAGVGIMRKQGFGGDVINIVSKNAVVAGPNNPGYGSAKAAQAHLTRLMAAELGADKIRVNTINPDAVIADSHIWAGEWAAGRAKAYGITVAELPAYYAKRTLLNEIILPDDIANACFVLVGGLLNKSTGNAINVDGGVAMGFYR